MDDTFFLIREWAGARNLIEERYIPNQSLKAIEEMGECFGALARIPAAKAAGNEDRVEELIDLAADGFGDIIVVLTIMAAQLGLDIEECIALAYDEIKDRRGVMVDGVFVKQ